MRIISDIQKNIIERNNIDSVQYDSNFVFDKSIYADEVFTQIKTDVLSVLPKPPLNSSTITQSEILEISRKTLNRTPEQIKMVRLVDKNPLLWLSPTLEKLRIKFTVNMLENLYYPNISKLVSTLKYFYNRARPIQLADYYDVDIKLIYTKTHHTPAYPSGHTMYAALGSEMLKDLYPQYTDIFDNWVTDVGEARVIQGVHFPSDNKAAVQIIKNIYPYIKEND
jgi:hypothetical protein